MKPVVVLQGTLTAEKMEDCGTTLRACLVCSLIKSFYLFERDGCDNCEGFLNMKNNRRNVYKCTSSNFDGVTAYTGPGNNCLAKWNGIQQFCKGIYAISVSGEIPDAAVTRDVKSSVFKFRRGFK